MKALVLTPQKFVNAEKEIPAAHGKYVTLKTAYAPICGSDMGAWCHPTLENWTIGHEFSGWIEDPGDFPLKKGQPVCAPEINPCGECEFCRSGRENLCPTMVMGAPGCTMDGAYGEYFLARGDLVHELPEDMPLQLGAIAEPVAVSLHGVRRAGDVKGKSVLVWGNGPIGVYAAIAAKHSGAEKIYMVGRNEGRVSFCNKLGYVDGCFSVLDGDFDAKMQAAAPGGFEIVIDALGNESSYNGICRHVKPGGTAALLGLHSAEVNFSTYALLAKEIDLRPSWFFTLHDYYDAVKMISENRDLFMATITNEIPCRADEVQEMFLKLFESGKNDEMKVVINPNL